MSILEESACLRSAKQHFVSIKERFRLAAENIRSARCSLSVSYSQHIKNWESGNKHVESKYCISGIFSKLENEIKDFKHIKVFKHIIYKFKIKHSLHSSRPLPSVTILSLVGRGKRAAKIYKRFCIREWKWLAVMKRWHLAFNVLYHMQGNITQCWLAETEGIFS